MGKIAILMTLAAIDLACGTYFLPYLIMLCLAIVALDHALKVIDDYLPERYRFL